MGFIIAGFPKIGISYSAKKHPDLIVDQDISEGTSIERYVSFMDRVDNIQETYNKYYGQEKIITCVANLDLLEELKRRKLGFLAVFPDISGKSLATILLRCIKDGDSYLYAKYIFDNWNDWITGLEKYYHITLKNGMYFEDILDQTLLMDYGNHGNGAE